MYSYSSFSLLHKVNEVIHYLNLRRASINEIQVIYFEPKPLESRFIISWFVQSNDSFDIQSIEKLTVVFRRVKSLPVLIITFSRRSHES